MSFSFLQANKKIAYAKLAKDFQTVLKEFQKAQRLSAERETAYTPFVPQSVLSSSEVDVTSDKPPEQRALLMESKRQEVLFLDNEIAFNEAIIEEREQDDIGSNIENSHVATAQAKSQLAKASKTQRSNSSMSKTLNSFVNQTHYIRAADRMPLADDFTECFHLDLIHVVCACGVSYVRASLIKKYVFFGLPLSVNDCLLFFNNDTRFRVYRDRLCVCGWG
ncbi:unnamed protein product [Lupinus luteus]|uniref:Uncharacterized protein n=1 Tax=Lupinus luteus TaxID=3873 RepID=A0AAV1WS67_LUPLU